ncbi:hypothetical protein M408DRAFT_333312 [Serendipita vermifera MAFF 305830]|uniref:PH domain-containing protein n=1 Tax=Serendipita vermifera MAFF 305830 TaxID=933852 RepID=A0A0C3AR20_SERVB|nr:hypothetical protein M408DRAFT_333312 [Serendipita vermifera MAFF 305830]
MSTPAINLDSRQTTEAPKAPPDTIVTLEPAPALKHFEDDHHPKRFFLGPMPVDVATKEHITHESTDTPGTTSGLGKSFGLTGIRTKLFGHAPKPRRSLSSEEGVSRERAFLFFVREGGRPEEFESREQGVRQEILRRVQRTRWFPADGKGGSSSNQPNASSNWVGDTFEIGKDLLGLSTLAPKEEEPAAVGRISLSSPRQSFNSPEAATASFAHARKGDKTVESPEAITSTKPKIHMHSSSSSSNVQSYYSASSSASGSKVAVASNLSTPPTGGEPSTSTTRLMTPLPVISRGPSAISAAHSDTKVVAPPPSRPDLLDTATAPVVNPLRSALRARDGTEGRGKAGARVMFPENAEIPRSDSPVSEEPAPPSEVLNREPTVTTSAGAAARVNNELEPEDGSDILIRDRMLVRVLSIPSAVQKYLDEQQLLEMPEARKDRATMWREYLVVWKLSCIELYEPYTIPAKEWVTKHKHLAFKIPLVQSKTKVSVFSNVDMTLCITCPKTSAHSHLPTHLMSREDKLTTMIMIMKTKSRSRSVDWIWRLWRRLGGEVPESIEIRCPAIDARVSFPIPAIDMISGVEGYKSFTHERVIQNCREQMSGIPEWDLLIESALKKGDDGQEGKLELCWRTESKLDWAWLLEDINGEPRPWAVLFGVALANPRTTSDLELRVAEHFPTKISLGNNTVLHEPPAIEGYLYRYKTTTHIRDPVYLSTHNGNIFFLNPNSAHPPLPPTAALEEPLEAEEGNPTTIGGTTGAGTGASVSSHGPKPHSTVTRASEVQRGASQILNAKLFLDMRNIVSVRRLTEPAGSKPSGGLNPGKGKAPSVISRERRQSTTTHGSSSTSEAQEIAATSVGHSDSRAGHPPPANEEEGDHFENPDEIHLDDEDLADIGGDEVLDKLTGDAKANLKMKRSFEILTRSQETIQFEAYSCKVCVEWIKRIQELTSYWTRKQRIDARLEMDIVHAMAGRTRFLVPRVGENVYPAPPPDPRDASPLLGRWWHWCVLNGCRSIVRAGRLYVRTSTRGEMRHFYFVLVQGHLVRFKLTSSRSQPASILHTHAKTINLLDAYVTSGYFAALELDEGNKLFEPTARRFQDGLETDDADMDTLIVIRYRPRPIDHALQHHARSSVGDFTLATATTTAPTGKTGGTHGEEAHSDVPPLNGSHKLLVLRARSKLERDAWCWALNAEIERLVRVHAVREQAVREDGGIYPS